MKLCSFIYITAFLCLAVGNAYGNEAEIPKVEPESEPPKTFIELADLRGALTAEISTLEKDIKSIEENISEYEYDDDFSAIDEYKKVLDSLNTKTALSELEQKKRDFFKERLSFMEKQKKKIEKNKLTLASKKVELLNKKESFKRIQKKIQDLLNPEQQFKRTMSMIFALLIGCVIVGFFMIAMRDEKIRQAIFSGQSGIQFLTLFSVVIAIILFGITGILEGKELAALLGGISGYILGKVAT